ncbi:MAG: hypothetical protein JRH20_32660, partial [Deltaproteobacteria bacterium]|nr:hypothetical protein [Deltaproteobacteria bacterium]
VLGERWIDGKAGKVEGSVEYLFARRFEPLAVVADSTSWFFECDVRDAPRAAFDSGGQLVWRADVTPFGQQIDLTGPDAVPWRMAGQYADSTTGLSYNRFRYYDADLCLYTQSDPSGIFGGLSPHAYVPDPLAFVDPYGLNKCKAARTGGGQKLYRELSPDDRAAYDAGAAIMPKGTSAAGSKGIAHHVASGESGYLSASLHPEATSRFGTGSGLAEIDVGKLESTGSTIVDHGNVMQAVNRHGSTLDLANAATAEEVLIKGGIDPSAITSIN